MKSTLTPDYPHIKEGLYKFSRMLAESTVHTTQEQTQVVFNFGTQILKHCNKYQHILNLKDYNDFLIQYYMLEDKINLQSCSQ